MLMICKKCSTFATAFQKGKFRDVAQLVAHLVWDQRVARSSRVIPTSTVWFLSNVFVKPNELS